MWTLLFDHFRPESFLEIGVYRGQILALATMLHKLLQIEGSVVGMSPFSSAGDSVSVYMDGLDYRLDIMEHFEHFALPLPILIEARSQDELGKAFVRSREWDCIYIDGCHDFEAVQADWHTSSNSVRRGGFIVLDDAALFTLFEPPPYAFKGHPGPSTVADTIDPRCFREVLRVGHNRAFLKL
jgi:hypothetical protein